MHNVFTPLFMAHAAAGSVMLLSGGIAMGAKKGRSAHRIAGKVYAVATSLVAVTGFTIAIQKDNQFLIATSIFVLYMMVSAYRSLYLKQLHKVIRAAPVDWLIIGAAGVASVYLLYMGISGVVAGNYGGLAPMVFGFICLRFSIRDVRKFTKGPDDKKHWLYNHISGMIGSYIAGITAFLAVNAGFFGNSFSLVVWLAPTAIGVPYIVRTIKKYKNKDGAMRGLKVQIGAAEGGDV